MRVFWCFTYFLVFSNNVFGTEKTINYEKVKALYSEIQRNYREVPEMSISQVRNTPASEMIIVDVRGEEERSVSIIPGAISEKQFEQQTDQSKIIVAYCTIGLRSAKFVRKIRQRGIPAFNLEGSILGWVHENGPLVDSKGKAVKRVHIYGPKWNLLPAGYVGIW